MKTRHKSEIRLHDIDINKIHAIEIMLNLVNYNNYDDWWSISIVACGTIVLVGLLIGFYKLIVPVIFPTIITYPWPKIEDKKSSHRQDKDKQRTVVFAGSFNPPHNGHLAMTRYLAERYVNYYRINETTFYDFY